MNFQQTFSRTGRLTILGMLMAWASPASAAPVQMPADLDLVMRSGASFLTIRLADLKNNELLRAFPAKVKHEILQDIDRLKNDFGTPGSEIERLTFLVPEKVGFPVVMVRTTQPYDHDAIKKQLTPDAIAEVHRGKTIFASRRHFQAFCPIDDRVYLLSKAKVIQQLLDDATGKGDPALNEAVALAAGNHHVVLGTRPSAVIALGAYSFLSARAEAQRAVEVEMKAREEAIRQQKQAQPMRNPPPPPPVDREIPTSYQPGESEDSEPGFPMPSLEQILEELPPQALPFKPLLLAKTITGLVDVGLETRGQFRLMYAREEDAKDGEVSVRMGLYLLSEMVPWWYRDMRGDSPSERNPLPALLAQLHRDIRSAQVKRDRSEVTASVSLHTKAESLAEFIDEGQKQAQYMVSLGNLKQMALAIHNYQDVLGAMPPAAICDARGNPLLSWRVAILPYIEEGDLYNQFKLDEPWDSEHNKKLIAKMPRTYAPARGDAMPGMTYYRVFAGPDAAFELRVPRRGNVPPLGKKLHQLPDGSSNSLLIVEAGEAVPWTKPEPIPFDMKKDPPKLGGVFKEGFSAAMADGSVLFIKNTIDPKLLKLLVNIQDGVAFNWRDVPVRGGGRDRHSHGAHEGESFPPRINVVPETPTPPMGAPDLPTPPRPLSP